MLITLTFLRVSSRKTPYVIALSIADRKVTYLLDCPDGTQRALQNSTLKVKNIKCVFLTRRGPEAEGGLAGLILTRTNGGVSTSLPVHCFASCKRKGAKQEYTPVETEYRHGEYIDEDIRVMPVVFNEKVVGIRVSVINLPPKFDGKKAKERQLPSGPIRGRLAKGEDVYVDGELVRASDFLIKASFKDILILPRVRNVAIVPFDLSDFSYVVAPASAWPEHVTYNTKPILFDASCLPYPTWHCLNVIRQSLTPSAGYFVEDPYAFLPSRQHTICGDAVFSCYPRPSDISYFADTVPNAETSRQYAAAHKVLREGAPQIEFIPMIPVSDYPRVIVLGSGAMYPSRFRNVQSILVKLDPTTSYLVDCGEDTFGQLMTYCHRDLKTLEEEMQLIHAVLITHEHADHWLGLWKFACVYRKLLGHNLDVYTPTALGLKYCNYKNAGQLAATEEIRQLYSFHVPHTDHSYGYALYDGENSLIVITGDTLVSAAPVICVEKLRSQISAKLRVMLIHEATLANSRTADAVDRNHSTANDAVCCGLAAKADIIVLTHISQKFARCNPTVTFPIPAVPVSLARYLKEPVMAETLIVSAVDLLTVSFENARQLCENEKIYNAYIMDEE